VDREIIEVVDYLGITLFGQASVAFAPLAVPGTTFFTPAFTPGATRLGGAVPYQVVPMIRGEMQPCGGLGSAASVSATPCAPRRFAVSPRVRRSRNGSIVRVPTAVPRAGRLTVFGAGSAGRLIRRSSLNVNRAGRFAVPARLSGRGKRVLRKRGRLVVRVRVRFNPRNGRAATKQIRIRFRR
jgi:hypothetical protein